MKIVFFSELIDPIAKMLNWQWMEQISFGSIILRLCLAIITAGLIGVQRAYKRHAAGFRTYVLVGIGATIAMMTNQYLAEMYNTDAARLGAQVISGIGFLGAGTIIVTSRNQIRGLTTAAGLWAVACMGLAIGAGFYTLAILGVIVILLVLMLFHKIEIFFVNQATTYEIHVELDSRPDLKLLINYLRNNNIQIFSLEHNEAYSSSGLSVYTITVELQKESRKKFKTSKDLVNSIGELAYVNFVEIIL